MVEGAHWVGSLAFDLRCREPTALDPVRSAVRNDLDSIVMRPLQAVLDRADTPGRIVHRRRIEVDLGCVRLADFTTAFISRRIAEGVGRQLVGAWAAPAAGAAPASDDAEQLAAFLRSGALPWAAPGQALAALCAALLTLDDGGIAALAERLRPLLSVERIAVRFARQCPAALVVRIAAALARATSTSRKQTDGFMADSEARLWARLIAALAAGERSAARQLCEYLEDGSKALGDDARPPTERARINAGAEEESFLPITKKEEGETERNTGLVLPKCLPVDVAGMVLLHPFLDGLCRAAGLLDEKNEFNGPEAQERAVLLLHFVATAREEAAEPDLVLPKLLCGMPVDGLVPRQIVPTSTERNEAETLLLAAIAHWSALGDTSPAALRETFIERPGQLRRDGDDWRLTVEPRGVDVLLDRLPWAISIVRTRFMPRPLRVEWR